MLIRLKHKHDLFKQSFLKKESRQALKSRTKTKRKWWKYHFQTIALSFFLNLLPSVRFQTQICNVNHHRNETLTLLWHTVVLYSIFRTSVKKVYQMSEISASMLAQILNMIETCIWVLESSPFSNDGIWLWWLIVKVYIHIYKFIGIIAHSSHFLWITV